MSTNEKEYMAVGAAAKEAIWITWLIRELGVEQGEIQLHCASQSVIYFANNKVYHDRIKHIGETFYMIKRLLAYGQILLENVHTLENAVDMLIKSVISDNFKHCLDLIHVFHC